jgi:hypothetical protein
LFQSDIAFGVEIAYAAPPLERHCKFYANFAVRLCDGKAINAS